MNIVFQRKAEYGLSRCLGARELFQSPFVHMNRLNKTESAGFFFTLKVLFISKGSNSPDYLEVTTSAIVSLGVGKTSPQTSI